MQRGSSWPQVRSNSRIHRNSTGQRILPVGTTKLYSGAATSVENARTSKTTCSKIFIVQEDISKQTLSRLQKSDYLSIDTEGGGLDFRATTGPKLIQICTSMNEILFIKDPTHASTNLKRLLESKITQIYHHAGYDLKQLKVLLNLHWQWLDCIHCTKTLRKIIHPKHRSGLASSLANVLNIKIDKKEQVSDWTQNLTQSQIDYAADDVLFLHDLFNALHYVMSRRERFLYRLAMEQIINNATLEVEGYIDLLEYEQTDSSTVMSCRNWWKQRKNLIKSKQ